MAFKKRKTIKKERPENKYLKGSPTVEVPYGGKAAAKKVKGL